MDKFIKPAAALYAATHADVSDRLGKYLVGACFIDGAKWFAINSIETVFANHLEFTTNTFPLGTARGAAIHAAREIQEVIHELDFTGDKKKIATEIGDVIACLVDCANRAGISVEELKMAFAAKLEINKARKWKDNGDGSYSHIKEGGAHE